MSDPVAQPGGTSFFWCRQMREKQWCSPLSSLRGEGLWSQMRRKMLEPRRECGLNTPACPSILPAGYSFGRLEEQKVPPPASAGLGQCRNCGR